MFLSLFIYALGAFDACDRCTAYDGQSSFYRIDLPSIRNPECRRPSNCRCYVYEEYFDLPIGFSSAEEAIAAFRDWLLQREEDRGTNSFDIFRFLEWLSEIPYIE